MERRKFVQSTLGLLATTGMASPVMSREYMPPKKGFKVKALETRYKEKIVYAGMPVDFKLLGSDTDNRLSVFISSNNQRGFGPPLHVHYSFDAFFCVLDGVFSFELDGEIFTLEMGDSLFIPRNVKHRFMNTSETAGTLLVGMTPAKNMEEYFAEMRNQLSDTGIPNMQAMQAVYKKYDSEILGPPMQ